MNDSGSATLGILIIIGLFVVCLVWEILKRKANTALNRNVFSRGTYQEQQALTEHRFTYPCRAKWSDVKPLLKESPLGDNLQIAKETDGGVQWTYYAFHLRTTGNGEFTAYLQVDEKAQRATFEFIRWANVDGVVRHIDQMKQLKTWVQDVIEQANRDQTAQSTQSTQPTTQPSPQSTQPARPVSSPNPSQPSRQSTQPAQPLQPATHAVPLPSQGPVVRIRPRAQAPTPATDDSSTGAAAPAVPSAQDPAPATADQTTSTASASEEGTSSALAENHMKPTKPFTPADWTVGEWHSLLPMFQQRWQYAAFVPAAIGLIGVLYFGFKPAGSYAGYTAGSIILPDRYTDYGTGSVLDEYGYMSADQLNRILGDLRGGNMHGFIGWILFTLAMLALIAVLSMAYDASSRSMATLLSNDDDMYRFFRDRYESEHGTYKPSFQDEALHLPLTIADYSYEWLLRPGSLSANENAPITETYKTAIYQQSRTFLGRLYLLYNDLWFDATTTTAKRMFGALGGNATPAATAPTWQDMAAQTQSQRPQGTTERSEKAPTASAGPTGPTTSVAPTASMNPAASPAAPISPVTPTATTKPAEPVSLTPAPESTSTSAPAPPPAPAPAPATMHTPAPVSAATPGNVASGTSGNTTPFTPRSQTPPVPLPQPTAVPVAKSFTSREFKFCGQCGTRIARDVAFCTQCGAKCV